ncbi:LacI family DNA-binding transcriptional regulator [Actinomyces sp. 186855]|uniref:LacI family DNA-binding transcriptional regulator n=1 Tax=Actinomyces sp. 186855 TaxID=2761164 RepID=UPI002A2E32C9|nr:LacI family DNA-binding transcriptional regulator [Actinomyces sp. 187325]MCL3791299.1 LacI family DNA-binding transcriptional regulator [Actinomyces sp. 186855]
MTGVKLATQPRRCQPSQCRVGAAPHGPAAAGVSAQTVSRVSNHHPGVTEPTRQRVLAAMKDLGYRPNAAARALKSGSFRTIGVVMFDVVSTGNNSVLAAVNDAVSERGFTTALLTPRSRTRACLSSAFERLDELSVDGAVLMLEVSPDDPGFTVPDYDNLVIVDSTLGGSRAVVDTDQEGGAHSAVEHLLDLGHATVHHVTGPASSYSAQRRCAAWRAALTEAGRPVPQEVRGDWTPASGYAAGRELLRDPSCTAVFCANDEMAVGLLRAAAEAGRRVPEELSVVGFDDIPLVTYLPVPLTTVHQDFAEMGRVAVDRLMRIIATGEADPGARLVGTRLVRRASTAPPVGP